MSKEKTNHMIGLFFVIISMIQIYKNDILYFYNTKEGDKNMKVYTVYECEKCGRTSRAKAPIQICEARHYGLTTDQMEQYNKLKHKILQASSTLSKCRNEKTNAEYSKAIDEIIQFEKSHGIK